MNSLLWMTSFIVSQIEWLFQIPPLSIWIRTKISSGMIMHVWWWNDDNDDDDIYFIDALFPEAIEANKSRMEEVMKKVEAVRGMTSGGNSQDPQTSMFIEWHDINMNMTL